MPKCKVNKQHFTCVVPAYPPPFGGELFCTNIYNVRKIMLILNFLNTFENVHLTPTFQISKYATACSRPYVMSDFFCLSCLHEVSM